LASFELMDLLFQGVELVTSSGKQFTLQLELFTGHQFKTLKGLRQQGFQVAFEISSRPRAQEPEHPVLKIVKKRLSIHGESSLARGVAE
jgi:hypothetical protein